LIRRIWGQRRRKSVVANVTNIAMLNRMIPLMEKVSPRLYTFLPESVKNIQHLGK
jgi:hypothetical protein